MSYDPELEFASRKEQLIYWKRPEDRYEIPNTREEWKSKDEQYLYFMTNTSVKFTNASRRHPLRKEYKKIDDELHELIHAEDAIGEDIIDALIGIQTFIANKIKRAFDDEKKIQAQNYPQWLFSIVEGLAEFDDYFSGADDMHQCNPLGFDKPIVLEKCHLSTLIALRNTAIYLLCYDIYGLADKFCSEAPPKNKDYLFALYTFMKANKKTLIDDKDAPIHRVRIEKDGNHVAAIAGDIIAIKEFLQDKNKKQKN